MSDEIFKSELQSDKNSPKQEINHRATAIGKALKLSPPFPLPHTVRAVFTAYGAPSNYLFHQNRFEVTLLSVQVDLFNAC